MKPKAHETTKQELYATLPKAKITQLTSILDAITGYKNQSIHDFYQNIKTNNITSTLFSILHKFFYYVFSQQSQTVEQDGHIIIGNGLDLTANPDAIAIFYNIDPSKDWQTLLKKPGEPNPALTTKQIQQVLYYALVGTTNKHGTFPGFLTTLNNTLADYADSPITMYQLFGLTGLSYATNGKLPKNTDVAMDALINQGRDIELLEIIVEYANPNYTVPLQNKLLEIGAVAHGAKELEDLDVGLTFRTEQRVLKVNKNASIINGPVRNGIPINHYRTDDFLGFNKILQLPSLNPDSTVNDSVVFGTPLNDTLTTYGNVIYGGAGDDSLDFTITKAYLFAAGNLGYDDYGVSFPTDYNVKYSFDDSDHRGFIKTYSYPDKECIFGGPIMDHTLQTCSISLTSKLIAKDNNTTTLKLNNFIHVISNTTLEINDFLPGQFNVLIGGEHHKLSPSPYFDNPQAASVAPKGEIAIFNQVYSTNITVFSPKGQLIKNTMLPNFPQSLEAFQMQNTNDDSAFIIAAHFQQPPLRVTNFTYIDVKLATGAMNITKIPDSYYCGTLAPTYIESNEIAMVCSHPKSFKPPFTDYEIKIYTHRLGYKTITNIGNQNSPPNIIAVPTNNGFIVSVISASKNQKYTSDLYFLTPDAKITNNYSFENLNFIALTSDEDITQIIYCNQTAKYDNKIHVNTFLNGFWSTPYILNNPSPENFCPNPSGRLPIYHVGNHITIIQNYVFGNYFFDTTNNRKIFGPFGYSNSTLPNTIKAATYLKNGNALLVTFDGLITYSAVNLPTSQIIPQPLSTTAKEQATSQVLPSNEALSSKVSSVDDNFTNKPLETLENSSFETSAANKLSASWQQLDIYNILPVIMLLAANSRYLLNDITTHLLPTSVSEPITTLDNSNGLTLYQPKQANPHPPLSVDTWHCVTGFQEDGLPIASCHHSDFQAIIMPSYSLSGFNTISSNTSSLETMPVFDRATCHPISFYGNESIICKTTDGQFTGIFTPTFSPSTTETIFNDGPSHLALAFVSFHLTKNLWSWLTHTSTSDEAATATCKKETYSKASLRYDLQSCQDKLTALKETMDSLKYFPEWRFYRIAYEDVLEDLEETFSLFQQLDKIDTKEYQEFSADLDYALKDIEEDKKPFDEKYGHMTKEEIEALKPASTFGRFFTPVTSAWQTISDGLTYMSGYSTKAYRM